ncbi:proline-rich receptor-like protein kinase PERK3 [Heracleum sosnowskyi]|uniref:Proline-rich receptor-like protein kinase PERK3 n=1 Tax=Heracleum sosnowskyi TaxID=360622 RepID=A0AAD8GZ09_9APIA|nr:proline-rich receptor-like protein kinase PERK3 [Heracleum sosnowskyi]
MSDLFLMFGVLKKFRSSLLKWMLISLYAVVSICADLPNTPLEEQIRSPSHRPLQASAIPKFRLLVDLPVFHKPHRKRITHNPVPDLPLAPAQPPYNNPLIASAHAPSNSHFSKPSMRKSKSLPPTAAMAPPWLENISPTQSDPGAIPTGLAHPPRPPNCCGHDMVLKRGTQACHCVYPIKLDILLINVSSNPNWNIVLEEFAYQLGLRGSQIAPINFYVVTSSNWNISVAITPHTGKSFSAVEASGINSSLSMHRVRTNPKLVGDYKILNFTWFQPQASSQASPAGAPLYKPSSSKELNTSSNGKHPSIILIVGIGVGVLIIGIISVLIVCSYTSQQGKKEKKETYLTETAKSRAVEALPRVGSLPLHPTSTRFLAYEELKEATNNFDSISVLGEGGFGRVFKGMLSDGTAVAIKRLTSGGQQGDKEFLVEVDMLSRLHHRNLVKLVGYYSNSDSSQKLLCYELVPNGSLEEWLHGPLGLNCPLNWETRMKIALDAARGLAYLHEDSQPCVIHRDFKASNILLENNFQAKVADFGLAKLAPEGRQNYLSTRVMGTFGYVAPEYAMTGHLLVKSDVYSYGVVLLELLTGRRPVDMSQSSGQENLVTWARPILRDKDRLDELADIRLGGKYPKEDFARVCTIAAACVAPEANQRPTMGEVVQSLKMVQHVMEYQDSVLTSNNRPTFASDGTSSIFSSGPYSGISAFENDVISRTTVFSEDLHEGR